MHLTSFPEGGREPAWSADGSRIAFVRGDQPSTLWVNNRGSSWHLYVVDDDGSGLARIGRGASPSWSPNGTSIAFATRGGLATMSPDGANRTTLWPVGRSPEWSPDGYQIAFVGSGKLGKSDVFLIDSDGTGTTRLTDTPNALRGLTGVLTRWHPDRVRSHPMLRAR